MGQCWEGAGLKKPRRPGGPEKTINMTLNRQKKKKKQTTKQRDGEKITKCIAKEPKTNYYKPWVSKTKKPKNTISAAKEIQGKQGRGKGAGPAGVIRSNRAQGGKNTKGGLWGKEKIVVGKSERGETKGEPPHILQNHSLATATEAKGWGGGGGNLKGELGAPNLGSFAGARAL